MQFIWSSAYTWKASYKGDTICSIQLPLHGRRDTWLVSPHLKHMSEYKNSIGSENLQDIIFDNIVFCVFADGQQGIGCAMNKPCTGGETATVLGKEIKNICRRACGWSFTRVSDPDKPAIKKIKRLIELEKEARDKGDIPSDEIFKQRIIKDGEQIDNSLVEYMKTKPKIEDAAVRFIEGENLKNLLDFTEWLKKIKMTPVWASWHTYKLNLKGQCIGQIHFGYFDFQPGYYTGNRWRLQFEHRLLTGDYPDLDDKSKETVWSNVRYCNDCCGCFPGRPMRICGREFDKVCGLSSVEFWNPDAIEIESAKQLILARRGM